MRLTTKCMSTPANGKCFLTAGVNILHFVLSQTIGYVRCYASITTVFITGFAPCLPATMSSTTFMPAVSIPNAA